MCDSLLENCQNIKDYSIRPDGSDLIKLTLLYYGNVALLPFSYFLVILATNQMNEAPEESGGQVVSWIYLLGAHMMLWIEPALIISLYMLSGSDSFLKDRSLKLVTRLPNYSLLLHTGTSLLLWANMFYKGGFYPYRAIWATFYSVLAIIAEYLSWQLNYNAILRIDY